MSDSLSWCMVLKMVVGLGSSCVMFGLNEMLFSRATIKIYQQRVDPFNLKTKQNDTFC